MNGKNLWLIFLLLPAAWLAGCSSYKSTDSPAASLAPTLMVWTVAGKPGVPGSTNGTGSSALFHTPRGITLDSPGNIYVADNGNYQIRKISPVGVVSTLAGLGTQGSANGPGTIASFNSPIGLAADPSGNIYVADQGSGLIREITPGGMVSTLAGGGPGTATNAVGILASFAGPAGVALDASGNLYVADTFNDLIRKIAPGGMVSTVAGQVGIQGSTNGAVSIATFAWPCSVAVDGSGNLYVGEWINDDIRKITPAGQVSPLAGFFSPITGIALDHSGNVYAADSIYGLVRKVSGSGVVSTFAGSGAVGFANGSVTSADFNNDQGIALDTSGNVYVADSNNDLIRRIGF